MSGAKRKADDAQVTTRSKTAKVEGKDKLPDNLKQEVEKLYNKVMDKQNGVHEEGIPAAGGQAWTPANDKNREDIQGIGEANGCWQCGMKIEDIEASWIADHIPPWSFHGKSAILDGIAKYAKDNGVKVPGEHATWDEWASGVTYLLPSCYNCSMTQSKLVKKIKGHAKAKPSTLDAYLAKLKPLKWNLLRGGDKRKVLKAIKVSTGDTKAAKKRWGKNDGCCHACGVLKSTSVDTAYVADHYPPQEFNTGYARILFDRAGIDVPDPVFRPHCPVCSGKQGSFNKVADRLQAIAKDVKIPVNK